MRWLAWLLFGFHGRVPRKWYWLGQVILLAAGVAVNVVVAGLVAPAPAMQPPVSILLANLLLLIPALAVVLKRLNDRGYAPWVVGLWLATNLTILLVTQTALVGMFKSWGPGGIALVITMGLVLIWFFIDLGFLQGERGPNRYGPNPLGLVDAGAPRRGRTYGENFRDGLVGFFALAAFLYFSGQGLNLVHWFTGPSELTQTQLLKLQAANGPAQKAQLEGMAASRAGNYDAAIAHFTRAIELYGKDSPAALLTYRSRASALHKMNRPLEAIADYDQVLTIDPARKATYGLRAITLKDLGRPDEALKGLDRGLEYNPASYLILLVRAGMLADAGRYDEAMADYDKALETARGRFKAAIWLSETLVSFSANKESPARNKVKTDLKKLVGHRDTLIAKVLTWRANLLFARGEIDEALADYNEALILYPTYGLAYRKRGLLHEQQGQSSLARADYWKAFTLVKTPDDWLERALERTKPPRQAAP